MKISHYSLRITYGVNETLSGVISDILTYPTYSDDQEWALTIAEHDYESYSNFIHRFLDILEGKYDALESVGIHRNNIMIFAQYHYCGECNTEFSPQELARLGNNGIRLCVSCVLDPSLE